MTAKLITSCVALGLLAVLHAPADAAVVASPIGTPSFVATDFHLFSAPSGTAADGFAAFGQTQGALLPPPNHIPNPLLGIGPGQPHAGPYDTEFARGVAANGFVDSAVFTTGQYSGGNGVYLVFMAVPGAGGATGSSPDAPSGPILPNALFPLTVDGTTLTDGVANDVLGQFTVPAINTVPEFAPAAVDGYSHVPFFFVDNFDFASRPVPGAYEYRITVTDAAGNGYLVSAPFQVVQAVPEPATRWLVGAASLACAALAFRVRPVDRPGRRSTAAWLQHVVLGRLPWITTSAAGSCMTRSSNSNQSRIAARSGIT